LALGIDINEKSVFIIQGIVVLIFAMAGLVYMFPFGCFFFGVVGLIVSFIVVKVYVGVMGGNRTGGGFLKNRKEEE